jgi:hypothetical protein
MGESLCWDCSGEDRGERKKKERETMRVRMFMVISYDGESEKGMSDGFGLGDEWEGEILGAEKMRSG